MRAIVFDPDAPRKFSFADAPDPAPTKPDELLIEVKAISLNFGEAYYGDNADSPGDIPGWDSAGVVLTPAADGSGPPAHSDHRRIGRCRSAGRPVGGAGGCARDRGGRQSRARCGSA